VLSCFGDALGFALFLRFGDALLCFGDVRYCAALHSGTPMSIEAACRGIASEPPPTKNSALKNAI
jgi:hypothetical protein